MDSEAHLEPGFDPNTLKVAELRGVLLKHDVDYPSSAKKSVLVDLFNQHVAVKAQTLRTASARVKPSAHGMIDAGFTPEKNEIGATPRRVRRSTRGTTEDTTEGEDDEDAPPKSTRKSYGRTPSRKRTSDVDPQYDHPPPSTTRKTRKSMARFPMEDEVSTPKREVEDVEEADTPFSSFNPFQMGSPSVPIKSPDADRRKTSVGLAPGAKKPLASLRRRTDSVRQYGADDYSTGIIPVNRRHSTRPTTNGSGVVKSEPVEFEFEMEPGEEFVPQEAAELAQEPPEELTRRRRQPSGAGSSLFLILVSATLLAYAIWWRAEKIEVGYCGVGGLDMRQPDRNPIVELLRPECETCPPHARCYPGMELDCVDDYIKVNSYLFLGGLWPIPPACVPDTEKERRVIIMSDAALDVLRKSGAEQRCKEKFLSGGMELEGVSEADLRQVLYDRKAASLSDREFSELWRHALEDVSNREEVIVETDESTTTGATETAQPNSNPRQLQLSRSAVQPASSSRDPWPDIEAKLLVRKHVVPCFVDVIDWWAIGMILLLIAGAKIRSTLAYKKAYNGKVTKLVHIALSHLAVNAIQHPDQPYIAVAHLRDQVLRHEFNPKTRKHLWDGVEKVVEQNSNIRAGEREIQGEIMRVWTWIGGRFVEGKSVFNDADELVQTSSLGWDRIPRPIV